MNRIIKSLTVALTLIAAVQATQALAQSNSQCDIGIPAVGDLNNVLCDPVTPNLLGRLNLDDPANGSGANYNYSVKLDQGSLISGVLLNANGTRTQRSAGTGGGNCPRANDNIVDNSTGVPVNCTLAVADSATVYRGAIAL